MPYTLTEQEKQEIIQSYQDNVGALNAYLPEGQKMFKKVWRERIFLLSLPM